MTFDRLSRNEPRPYAATSSQLASSYETTWVRAAADVRGNGVDLVPLLRAGHVELNFANEETASSR
jgi:hypothetical protein